MRVIYDMEVFISIHCEECGIIGCGYNSFFFAGHLADWADGIRTMREAKKAQTAHQKWHDACLAFENN